MKQFFFEKKEPILRSPENSVSGRVDDAKIVTDAIAEALPACRHGVAQEG
jgi:hypothetical protein